MESRKGSAIAAVPIPRRTVLRESAFLVMYIRLAISFDANNFCWTLFYDISVPDGSGSVGKYRNLHWPGFHGEDGFMPLCLPLW